MNKVLKHYPQSVEVITRIIRKHGTLHQDKFDEIFSDHKKQIITKDVKIAGTTYKAGTTLNRLRKLKIRDINGGPYILGGIHSFNNQQKWLHLLQIMCECGLVKTTKQGDKVLYSLIQE